MEKLIELRDQIGSAINCASYENESDTPDWILAQFAADVLEAGSNLIRARDQWYGITPEPGWCRERIKLSQLIAVWDDIHGRLDSLGFCDLDKALRKQGVLVENDIPQDQPAAPSNDKSKSDSDQGGTDGQT